MNRKPRVFIKKHWIAIWCALSVCILCVTSASAVYVGSFNSMKRVVVATSNKGKLFSSDWLYENGISNKKLRTKYFSDESQTGYDVDVHVFNYSRDDIYKHYGKDITYTLTAKFVTSNGTPITDLDIIGDRSVNLYCGETIIATLDRDHLYETTVIQTLQSLPGDTDLSSNSHKLHFNNWNIQTDSDICVSLQTNLSPRADFSDLVDLSGFISIGKTSVAQSTGWNGELKETGTVGNYDAFNFVLSGSGSATITFEWDTSKIAVNKYFYDSTDRVIQFDNNEVVYSDPGSGSTWATLVINANTDTLRTDESYRNRYAFQLYKVGGNNPSTISFISITTDGTEPSREGNLATCKIENVSN